MKKSGEKYLGVSCSPCPVVMVLSDRTVSTFSLSFSFAWGFEFCPVAPGAIWFVLPFLGNFVEDLAGSSLVFIHLVAVFVF